jgi:DNA-binding beta-propeller fold protein YncE
MMRETGNRICRSLLAAVLGAALYGGAAAHDHSAAWQKLFALVGDYPLGASVNRTDYESVDARERRLYIAKMGGGQLLVFDLDRNKLVAQLDGFPKVTGVLAVPELHKVYASVPGSGIVGSLFVGLGMAGLSRGHGEIVVRDTQTLKQRARLPGGVFPDGIAYDPENHRIFVSDELGSAISAIDGKADKLISYIEVGGQVGNVRYDAVTRKIYVPVQSHNELIAIDPARLTVTARHVLIGCEHPHGFIVAPKGTTGYVACDENDRLLTVDLSSGRILNKQPVAHDPDVLAIDPVSGRLYVATESGDLSTYDVAVPDAPKSLGDVFIAEDAHTLAVDPVTHRLYFALANLNGRAALRVLAPKGD